MGTPARKRSASGFYHVFQRGVNHFDIFEDDADRNCFMEILEKAAKLYGVKIYAWCLMSNHVHLLLNAGYEELSNTMRQLGSVYAKYFNRRHERSGPLFGGRFQSVCVETDAQFIAVVRYIHRNPIAHEESTLFGTYAWSSYSDYLGRSDGICDVPFSLDIFGGAGNFIRIHKETWPFERHIDVGTTRRMADEEARLIANVVLAKTGIGVRVSHIGALAQNLRDKAMLLLRQRVGCSLRQLQRLTAIPYSVIRKATKSPAELGSSQAGCPSFPNPFLLFTLENDDSLFPDELRDENCNSRILCAGRNLA